MRRDAESFGTALFRACQALICAEAEVAAVNAQEEAGGKCSACLGL